MTSTADWMVVVGFLLCVLGVTLRVAIMMRSTDALAANTTRLAGRDLVRAYRNSKPKSWLPLAMVLSVSSGLVLLIAGLLLEFR
jgi:hypothetical protein